MSTDNSAPGYRVTAGVRTPMWRIGPAHPDHPEYVRTDALNRADRAAEECACDSEHRNLRLSIREAVEELEHADHHGCAEIVRKTLWEQ